MLSTFFRHWLLSFQGIPKGAWLLSAVNLINRCGSMVLVFLSVYLTTHLGFNIKEAGYVMTCFGIGALVGMWLGGIATDRFGYYPIQLGSLALNGLLLIGMVWVKEFWTLCLTVFTLSLVAEMFRPANQVAIAYYSTVETRTRAISLQRMAFNLGFTLAPALGGILAGKMGWEWLFWADGITCLLSAVALRLLLKPGKVAKAESEVTRKTTPVIGDSPYRDRPFIAFTLLTFLGAMVFMQLIWTVPVFFKDSYQWNESSIGWAMALNGAIVFLIEMPFIFFAEGKKTMLNLVRWGILAYAISYLVFLLPIGALVATCLYMLFISIGEILVMPFSSNLVYRRAGERPNKGQYLAMFGLSYSVANILAPLLGTQLIAAWGYPALWTSAIALAFVTLGGFYWLEKRLPSWT